MTFVRFKPVTEMVRSISQKQLERLWFAGEGVQACPGQKGWDQVVPIKWSGGYSAWFIQSKNQVAGTPWASKYHSPAVFPGLPGSDGLQSI